MKKTVLPLFLIVLLFTPGLAVAESGKELIENSEIFDGNLVSFQGEVIGVMIRGDHAWVNVLDNGYAVGIWCRAEDARMISFIGDYGHVGDIVSVSGVFHKDCLEHGGDLDIHAENFTILVSGRVVERSPNALLFALSIVLIFAAIFFNAWLIHIRKEKEKLHYLMES